jgi:integrase
MTTSAQKYSIRTVCLPDGERLPFLMNVATGVPLFEPTVWSIRTARNKGLATKTIETRLRAAMVFTLFLADRDIDLSARMTKEGEILNAGEIDHLMAFCRQPIELMWDAPDEKTTHSRRSGKIVSLERVRMAGANPATTQSVKTETQRSRLLYIPDYLKHLVDNQLLRLNPKDPVYRALAARRDEVVVMIKERTPDHGWDSGEPRQGLDVEAHELFSEFIKPSATDKPWKVDHVRERNTLMFQWFLRLGLRRGEIGGIKIRNIDFTNNTVTVHRNADDPKDPRLDQPKTKTLPRILPLDPGLAQLTRDYITHTRSKIKGARKHNFLFVANGTGKPLSLRAINKAFESVKKRWPDVFDDLSPHVLRHTFNDDLTKEFDKNKTGSEEEKRLRQEVNGWRSDKVAARYTKRSTKARANTVLLEMQKKAMKGADNE